MTYGAMHTDIQKQLSFTRHATESLFNAPISADIYLVSCLMTTTSI